MGETISLTGMVLNAMPIGEYDKRITILTRERGKITAFARGARRPTSQLLAVANPFAFGEFELFEGKSTYNLSKASIQNYFREIVEEPENTCYGCYFLEIADYYGQENNDEKEMLKLLYQTLRALEHDGIGKQLVKCIFELRTLMIQGEYPNLFSCQECGVKENLTHFSFAKHGVICSECKKVSGDIRILESTLYTMQYVLSSELKKLYTFTVSEDVCRQFSEIMDKYMQLYVNHHFHSLDILQVMSL